MGFQVCERRNPSNPRLAGFFAAVIAGVLLLAGLWTPVSGCLIAALGLWSWIVNSGDPWRNILLASIGVALAMIGPGVWSLDARLFGWRRIDVRGPER